MRLRARAGVSALLLVAAAAAPMRGAGPVLHSYPIASPGSRPVGVGSGYDGLWFAENAANRVARIDNRGVVSEIALPNPGSGPYAVTSTSFGIDGNTFAFTELDGNRIGIVDAGGSLTEYEIPSRRSGPRGIASEYDFVWFTEFEASQIGRLDTRTGEIVEFPLPWPPRGPYGIATGWGGLWFTEFHGNRIGFITNQDGGVAEYRLGTPDSGPTAICADGEGGAWFVESEANRIARITAMGTISEFDVPTPDAGVEAVAAGWGGQAWFTERRAGKIGHIASDGTVREYALPPGSEPVGLAIGADRSVWYTDAATNSIGRLSGRSLFAVGAGSIGPWDTVFEIRGDDGRASRAWVGFFPPPSACPGQCPEPAVILDLAAGAVGRTSASEFQWDRGVRIVLIGALTDDDPALDSPDAVARITNRDRPEQTAVLPLVDNWTLFDAQPPVEGRDRNMPRPTLTFPARRIAGAHTNLVVANVGYEGLSIKIEIVATDGTVVRTFAPRGPSYTGQTEMFVDVLGTTPEGFDGSIRITRLSREGFFWATLANIGADGRLELLAPQTGMSLE